MKPVLIILIVFLALLEYQLWFGAGGIAFSFQLKKNIRDQIQENKELVNRNAALLADIESLKNGNEAIEDHARNDLGMIQHGEAFYQIVK